MKNNLAWGTQTFIMGIINLTPDSFSGDGLVKGANVVEQAVKQAKQMVADGAAILDFGAESSRPGAEPISIEEEIERLMPALKASPRGRWGNHPLGGYL